MAGRVLRTAGSALSLAGAFAVGGVVHGVAVTGSIEPFSPVAVGGVLAGGVLIVAGLRLERAFDPSEYVPGSGDEDAEDEEFDEDLSPVPEEALADREADEEYERS